MCSSKPCAAISAFKSNPLPGGPPKCGASASCRVRDSTSPSSCTPRSPSRSSVFSPRASTCRRSPTSPPPHSGHARGSTLTVPSGFAQILQTRSWAPSPFSVRTMVFALMSVAETAGLIFPTRARSSFSRLFYSPHVRGPPSCAFPRACSLSFPLPLPSFAISASRVKRAMPQALLRGRLNFAIRTGANTNGNKLADSNHSGTAWKTRPNQTPLHNTESYERV